METLMEFKAIIFLVVATAVTVVIYKMLGKSNIQLGGPFQGLNVKIIGPIAGFVVVFYSLMAMDDKQQAHRASLLADQIRLDANKNWTIKAQIVLLDQDSTEIKGPIRDNSLDNLRANLAPALPYTQPNFDKRNVVCFLPNDVVADPHSTLQFTIQGDPLFKDAYAPLNCETAKYDSVRKTINLGRIPIMRR